MVEKVPEDQTAFTCSAREGEMVARPRVMVRREGMFDGVVGM
jgi:hypothetical protein